MQKLFYNYSLQEGTPALSPASESGQSRGHSTLGQASQSEACQPAPPDQPGTGGGGGGAGPLRASRSSSSSSSSSTSQPEADVASAPEPIERRNATSLYSHWSRRSASQPIGRKMKQQNRSRKFK